MKKLLTLLWLAYPMCSHAEWKLNPYTQRQDYYEATAGVKASTGTLFTDLAAETARALAAEAALAVSSGATQADLDAYKITVQASTQSIYVALQSTAAQVTQVQTDLATEVSDRQIAVAAVAVSTGINSSDIANLKISTGALESSKVNRSGDTITGPVTVVSSSLTVSGAVISASRRSGRTSSRGLKKKQRVTPMHAASSKRLRGHLTRSDANWPSMRHGSQSLY